VQTLVVYIVAPGAQHCVKLTGVGKGSPHRRLLGTVVFVVVLKRMGREMRVLLQTAGVEVGRRLLVVVGLAAIFVVEGCGGGVNLG
jgi:hypothetical protein